MTRSQAEPLRVLVAHNAYRQAGGEDSVVESEIALLRARGHEVVELRRDNAEIATMGRLALAAGTLWSRRAADEAALLIARHRPHVAHVHNTLPLLSPAIHWACARAGVAVVQTLHNFRLACPQAMFLRAGAPCEDCFGRLPLPAIRHACYRGSRAQTALLAASIVLHRGIGTWRSSVDRFIALSEFSRGKFVAAGLPAGRIAVKPNFVDAPPADEDARRDGFLFVGRLSAEKGIDVLAAAFAGNDGPHVRVVGSGDGAACLGMNRVDLRGALPADEVMREMQRARALVLPSLTYENFPRTLAEAYAAGLPVIASRIGSLAELVEDGVTGMLFDSGNPIDLARVIAWADAHPDELAAMGRRARQRYQSLYTPAANYTQLIAIYRAAIAERASKGKEQAGVTREAG